MHESEPESFKVVDRRKFNAEGQRRTDNADLQAEEPKAAPVHEAERPAAGPRPLETPPDPQPEKTQPATAPETGGKADSRRDKAAAISFLEFIESLYMQAVIGMGLVPDPVTGIVNRNLEITRQMIKIIAMLREKTKGNLDPAESNTIENVLYELRMNFVAVSKQKS
jgi:hypothetical protein